MSKHKSVEHPDLEFTVRRDDQTFYYKESGAAAAAAIAIAIGRPDNSVTIDVLTHSREAALAFGGSSAAEHYDEDPDASVFERIIVSATSLGSVA